MVEFTLPSLPDPVTLFDPLTFTLTVLVTPSGQTFPAASGDSMNFVVDFFLTEGDKFDEDSEGWDNINVFLHV